MPKKSARKHKVKRIFTDDWQDAQAQSLLTPDTFKAPSAEQLVSVKVGYSVKISNGDERFWARVKSRKGNVIMGKVANVLQCGSEYNTGDVVQFGIQHIYDIIRPEERETIIKATRKDPAFKALKAQVHQFEQSPGSEASFHELAAQIDSHHTEILHRDETGPRAVERSDELLLRRCSHCRSPHAKKHCTVCFARYCSRECQRNDWSLHKLKCRKPVLAGGSSETKQNHKIDAVVV